MKSLSATAKRTLKVARAARAARAVRRAETPDQKQRARLALAEVLGEARGLLMKTGQVFATNDAEDPLRQLVTGVEPATVTAARRTRLLRVPVERYEQLLGASSSFRRTVGRARRCAPGALPVAHGPPPNTIEVLLLQSDIAGAPLGILTDLLARTLASDHGDDVAVLELVAPDEAPGPLPRPTPDPELPLAFVRKPAEGVDLNCGLMLSRGWPSHYTSLVVSRPS